MKEEEHARNALAINFRDAAAAAWSDLRSAGNAVTSFLLYEMNE
jgi:hypothetical protein